MQAANPFDLYQPEAYARWREAKLATLPGRVDDLVVEVADPRSLSRSERQALLEICAHSNMALYRSPRLGEDKDLARLIGTQLGLQRLDANWLADEDGISPIAVSATAGSRNDFIPYTDRAIGWHTDGYYHPDARRIEGMLLHCVRGAGEGGITGLADPDMLYIALRDANPAWVEALMAQDAMTIPEREDQHGVARPAQSGPVFCRRSDGGLHLRYTARTRSIVWKPDALTQQAVHFIEQVLASDPPWVFHLTLQAGMGLVSNNVLHRRSAFTDTPGQPRLLYRARYLDCITPVPQDTAMEMASA
ncbi:MAG: TauD/TfdA family dioxygenase [Hylemonella sp.]